MFSSDVLSRPLDDGDRHEVAERIRVLAKEHRSARFDWLIATAVSEVLQPECTTQAEWAGLAADLIDREPCRFADGWRCSECGEQLTPAMAVCPSCGRWVTSCE